MKKIIKYLLFILLITTGILAASGKLYYYKALVYNFVDIDDLNLFHNREVKNGTGLPWNFSTDYNKKNLTDTLTALLETIWCAKLSAPRNAVWNKCSSKSCWFL